MAKGKHHRRRGGMTIGKVLKGLLVFGPVLGKSANAYSAAGGGVQGFTRGIVPAITTSYTGINSNDGKFYPTELAWGWGPVVAVALASKAGLFRYLRL